MSSLVTRPTLVEWEDLRFLIMDTPSDQNVHLYIKELEKNQISAVCRACDPNYDSAPLIKAGIAVHELAFADGEPPPAHIISRWLEVVDEVFKKGNDGGGIAVHCVAGLGRAPVLVALALIEHGMEAVQTVDYIRTRRRGAINQKQLQYLISYTPTRRSGGCCAIM